MKAPGAAARTTALIVLLGTAPVYSGSGALPERISRIPVTVRFDDQPVARVLEGLFAAGQVRADVDPCVAGRVSIALENASLGSVLEELARVADLEIQALDAERIRVACRDARAPERPPRSPVRGRPLDLRFRLVRTPLDRPEERLYPRLVALLGEVAEVAGADEIPGWTITEDGEVAPKNRPAWRLRAIVVPAKHGLGREVRGLFEVAIGDPRGAEGTTVSTVMPFSASLADFERAQLAVIRVEGGTWELHGEAAE